MRKLPDLWYSGNGLFSDCVWNEALLVMEVGVRAEKTGLQCLNGMVTKFLQSLQKSSRNCIF